jgi:hypothetical protein
LTIFYEYVIYGKQIWHVESISYWDINELMAISNKGKILLRSYLGNPNLKNQSSSK